MNEPEFISDLFDDSTINPNCVSDYLEKGQNLYQQGLTLGFTDRFLAMLKIADRVDGEMRQYLLGKSRRMTGLNQIIRHFQGLNPYYAQLLIPLVLECIHQTVLLNEWYELLPRYTKARKRIQQQFTL